MGNIIQKYQSEGLKKVLKMGTGRFAIRRRGIRLQENYEMEEFYFSLSYYSIIHHVLILFKR